VGAGPQGHGARGVQHSPGMETARTRLGIVVAAGALWLAAPAGAATLYAANDGTDSASCGAQPSPCRSISAAILVAGDGDTIEVGPGRYGDLDGDGTLGSVPGEEPSPAACACLVHADKRLAIRSRDGAGATLLVSPTLPAISKVVALTVAGSAFGERNRGFTIFAGGADGIVASAADAEVAGNVVVFAVFGIHASAPGAIVSDNRVLEGQVGIQLDEARSAALRNSAIGNSLEGFYVAGADCLLESNAAISNGVGIGHTGTGGAVRGSIVAGNTAYGAAFSSAATRVERSSFSGNGIEAGTYANCGLVGPDGMNASGNYWGSASGPGADPADAVCGLAVGDEVVFAPFAAKDISLKLKPIR
jgi:hypothetical protein